LKVLDAKKNQNHVILVMMNKIFLTLVCAGIFNCTGWPILNHALQLQNGNKKDNNSLNLIGLLSLANNKQTKTTATTGTSDTSQSTTSTTSKDMLTFSIANPATTGIISGTTITVTLPTGYNLSPLTANFTHNGASVKIGATTQTSGSTANDFSYTLTYTVYAVDGTSQNYTVNVTSSDCDSSAYCVIFVYTPTIGANFSSIAGFGGDAIKAVDSECGANAGAAGAPGNKYRAMILSSGSITPRTLTQNWALKPSKQYRRTNGSTIIGTTNSSSIFPVFSTPLTNAISATFVNVYTGITVTSNTVWTQTNNCNNWSVTSGTADGGAGNLTGSGIVEGNPLACNLGVAVYCVQQ
jgi:Protein of unknown function (DUF1554)